MMNKKGVWSASVGRLILIRLLLGKARSLSIHILGINDPMQIEALLLSLALACLSQ
jgi:hypothetical protein